MIYFYALSFLTRLAKAQEEIDLSSLTTEKSYPYYEPLVRHNAYLLLPALTFLWIAVHLIKSTKRKAVSGRAPEMFFYPETEKSLEKRK